MTCSGPSDQDAFGALCQGLPALRLHRAVLQTAKYPEGDKSEPGKVPILSLPFCKSSGTTEPPDFYNLRRGIVKVRQGHGRVQTMVIRTGTRGSSLRSSIVPTSTVTVAETSNPRRLMDSFRLAKALGSGQLRVDPSRLYA